MSDESKKPKSKKHLVGGLIVAAAAFSVFFIDWKPGTDEPAPVIRPLKTLEVGATFAGTEWQYPGKVAAGEEATLSFEVGGKIQELSVKEGEEVSKGQVLARLDDRDYRNAAASARAEVDRSQAQYDRVKEAAAAKAVSEQELSNARAALDKAKAQLDIQQKALEETVLTARFAGTIARTYVKGFENIQAKQNIILLQNMERIEIIAAIPEARLAHVDPAKRNDEEVKKDLGLYAQFDYFPGRSFPLEPKEFSTEADPMTQTFTATLAMDTPKDVTILPGMTATVFETPKQQTAAELLVPLSAVPVDGVGQYYVWLLKDAGEGVLEATRRDVTVGEITGPNIVITSGLERGQRIAAAGVHILVEGQQVRPL